MLAGQEQKELFVNELAARLDALLHGAIEAELAVPPASPRDGQAWLIATGASGAGRLAKLPPDRLETGCILCRATGCACLIAQPDRTFALEVPGKWPAGRSHQAAGPPSTMRRGPRSAPCSAA